MLADDKSRVNHLLSIRLSLLVKVVGLTVLKQYFCWLVLKGPKGILYFMKLKQEKVFYGYIFDVELESPTTRSGSTGKIHTTTHTLKCFLKSLHCLKLSKNELINMSILNKNKWLWGGFTDRWSLSLIIWAWLLITAQLIKLEAGLCIWMFDKCFFI